MLPLKPLSRGAIPAALAKAERYRLLNEPQEAESICLDVVEVEPDNQLALTLLLLALTDQFDEGGAQLAERAQRVLERLQSEYERAYYGALMSERRAKAHLRLDAPGTNAVVFHGLQ